MRPPPHQLRQQIDAEEAQVREPLGQLNVKLQRQIETVRRTLAQSLEAEATVA